MSRLNIDTGTLGNTATGDTLRTAMTKVNTNFEEVYQLVGNADDGLITTTITNGDLKLQANGTGIIEVDQLQINNSTITPLTTNADLTLSTNGSGNIVVGAITVNGTTISSADSSKISINEALDIDGNLVVSASQIDFTNLPTSNPNVAGRVFRNGNDLRISTG